MSVDPVPGLIHAAREMDFPDIGQRQLIEYVRDALTAVALVAPQVVKVEKDAAVRCARDGREEVAIIHLFIALS